MEKKVVWTKHAKGDLQSIYEFNIPIQGEEKSYLLIEKLVKKVDTLYKGVTGGTRYVSDRNPNIKYEKLIYKYYLIIYRKEGNQVYINRIFDARQNPTKLDL